MIRCLTVNFGRAASDVGGTCGKTRHPGRFGLPTAKMVKLQGFVAMIGGYNRASKGATTPGLDLPHGQPPKCPTNILKVGVANHLQL